MIELTKENYLKIKVTGRFTRPQIAGEFGIPEWKLKKWISSNSLGTPRPRIKYPRAFREVTEEASYWAGFLAADGCVDEVGRVRLYLQLSDHPHLQKFAEFVGSNHTLSLNEKRNRCSLEFTCKDMVEDLLRWNIVPRKSILYCPPERVGLLQPFLRGLFDGDGTICESFSNKRSITATLYAGLACSYACRDWLIRVLPLISEKITLKQHERDNHVTITMNTNKSKVFLRYLNENSTQATRLDRKYNLYVKTVVNNDRKTR